MLQPNTVLFLASFATLAIIHVIAMQLALYWIIWWFDIFMHLFGGAVVALGVFTLVDLRFIPPTWLTLFWVLAGVLVAALVWEMFELIIGVPFDHTYLVDTVTDVVMGALGGAVGFLLGQQINYVRNL